jgi:hypothetical protein
MWKGERCFIPAQSSDLRPYVLCNCHRDELRMNHDDSFALNFSALNCWETKDGPSQ